MKISVFISGSGTNLQSIINAIEAGILNLEISCVVSSNSMAFGIQRAKKYDIPVLVMDKSSYEDPKAADNKILKFIKEYKTDYIVMAGYMRKVTDILLDAFTNRVLNIHPALLPSFKGAHAIRQAWDAGVKITGVTVHFANADYDNGPIIAQKAVSVLENDTFDSLEANIHKCEHELYLKVLQLLSRNRIKIVGNKVSCRGIE